MLTKDDRLAITRLMIEQYILICSTVEGNLEIRKIANNSFDKISDHWIETGKYLDGS